MNAIIFVAVYGYFALSFDGDPNDCYANDTDDNRIDHEGDGDTKDTQNVGAKFSFAFKILFFMTLLQVFITLFAAVLTKGSKSESRDRRRMFQMTIFMYSITSLIELALWIYLIVVRFTHQGQVCSGDFLRRTKPSVGYMIVQGRFIKIVTFILALSVFALFACAPFLSNKRA